MGELSLIEKFRAGAPGHPFITVGPGHDCAALRWPATEELLFKIDQVVEGTHFLLDGPNAISPEQVGWKAMAKTCSDIAAAGGWPVAAMVAINVRKGSSDNLPLGVYEGVLACCNRYGIGLAGGDFSTSENGLSVAVSLLGCCPGRGVWTRAGAKPGDVLLVTGTLGGSLHSKHFNFKPRLYEAREIRKFIPGEVHACIDITDGLSRDLQHLCTESKCGAIIYAKHIPISDAARSLVTPKVAIHRALSDGEDFELLLAVDPNAAKSLMVEWLDTCLAPLTQIGSVVESSAGISLVSLDGVSNSMPNVGYEHVV